MERIKGKFDDTENKIRPGSAWVSGFTLPGNNDDIRSVDSDGAEMRFIPASRYYASCNIKRGQAVSIAQLDDLTDKQKQNKYAYVKITDPDIDESCLGIAMNYAREGQIVQIQSKGKFNYYTTSSLLNTAARREHEIFLEADGWNFDEVRGQKLYIKKLYDDPTKSARIVSKESEYTDTANQVLTDNVGDAFDTDHSDTSVSASTDSVFTYDFYDSIYNVRNTIQIGYLTDAPTTKSKSGALKKVTDTNGNIQFTDSDGNTLKRAVVVVKDAKENIVIEEGSYDYDLGDKDDKGNKWWKDLKKENRLPKAHEAVWLHKFELVENGKTVTYYSPVDDEVVTVELDVTGDTRGPVDNTQFILTLGENIYFNTYKHDVDYSEIDKNGELVRAPNFNEGIYDEIKLVAIAEGNPSGPSFRFFLKSEVKDEDEKEKTTLDQGFIAIRKLDGDTWIIPILTNQTIEQFKNDTMEALIDPNDEGYYKLSKQFTAGVKREYHYNGEVIKRSPRIFFADPVNTLTRDQLKDRIVEVLQKIFVDEDTGVVGCTPVVTNVGNNGFFITTKETGGYYDVYVSQDVLGYVTFTAVDHGQIAKAGEAILADIRDANRLNVAGVVLSNQTGVRKRGETVKVMKMGRIVTLGNMLPGTEYYLGLNGRVTARAQYWYDHSVPVGTAESSNYLIVDISQFPLHSYAGNFPLGYLKPSIFGKAEKGFVLADGHTVYSKQEYPELYQMLLNWYDEEELKPSNLTEELFNAATADEIEGIFTELYNKIESVRLSNAKFQKEVTNTVQDCVLAVSRAEDRFKAIETLNEKQNGRLSDLETENKQQTTDFEKYKGEQAALDQQQSEALQSYKDEQATAQQQREEEELQYRESQAALDQKQQKDFEDYVTAQKTADEAQDKALEDYKESQSSTDEAQDEVFRQYKRDQKIRDEEQDRAASEALAAKVAELTTAISDAISTANQTAEEKDAAQTQSIRENVSQEIASAIANFVTTSALDAYKEAQAAVDQAQAERMSSIESVNEQQSTSIAENKEINDTQQTDIDRALSLEQTIEELSSELSEVQGSVATARQAEIDTLTESLASATSTIEILRKMLAKTAADVSITAKVANTEVKTGCVLLKDTNVKLLVNDDFADTKYWSGETVSANTNTATALAGGYVGYTNPITEKSDSFSSEILSLEDSSIEIVNAKKSYLAGEKIDLRIVTGDTNAPSVAYKLESPAELVTFAETAFEKSSEKTIKATLSKSGLAEIIFTTTATDSAGASEEKVSKLEVTVNSSNPVQY